jgi:hypothetical protein
VKLTIFITIPNSYSNVSQLSFAQSACWYRMQLSCTTECFIASKMKEQMLCLSLLCLILCSL